jgi:hypothetical protein
LYREYQQRIAACEEEMQRLMKGMEASATSSASLPTAKDSVRKCKVMVPAKAMALREEAYRILGVDLTTIPGISVLHVQTILAELGGGISMGLPPLLRQTVKTQFAVRCKFLDRQDHFKAF